jgi:hypothetical protein
MDSRTADLSTTIKFLTATKRALDHHSTKSSTNNNDHNNEPRRSGRVKRLNRDAASQASQDQELASGSNGGALERQMLEGREGEVNEHISSFYIGKTEAPNPPPQPKFI